jgi:serine/threonine-protein kinase
MSFGDLLSASLADRYRIERELGQGGMATVYLGHDLKHDRKVAIKVLRPELAEVLGAERFLREIRTTANLRHPHLLPLYDSGQVPEGRSERSDGPVFVYYVMPFIEGGTLRDRLDRDKQLPIDEALSIAREVADALGYAHAHGVIHRDIKPENILLEGGHAVVADFGIARAMTALGGERLTGTGVTLGTPTYMSPEQAGGDRHIDGRSDLYSLGCVLYEMLGGRAPFVGPTTESVIRQHVLTDAAPITNLRPTVPAEVAGALARTLAKNPADRFNPAAQFVHALSPASPRTTAPLAVEPPATPVASTASAALRTSMGKSRRLMLEWAAVGLAAVGLIGWFVTRERTASIPSTTIQRIAVLPMDNQTGDTAQRFFADGMTREVIGVLSEVGVRVLGHRAVAAYRGSSLPATRIAKELGVDAIVAGAVTRAGDVVQVSAELTDPSTGEALWSRTFSRPAADVIGLQREIAGEIARGISARLSPAQSRTLAESRPVKPRAYAEYLLGVEQTNLRTVESYGRSVTHLQRSLALDSTFAPAWATLAMTHAIGLFFQIIEADSARAAIGRAASHAIALDDRLGDSYIALGLLAAVADWNFKEADHQLALGMARNPSTQAQALYSWVLWETGRHAQAVLASRKIVDVEPTTAQWQSDLAWLLWSVPDVAASRAAAQRAIALDSAFYEPYHLMAWLDLGAGNLPAARRWVDEARVRAGGDFWLRESLEGHLHLAAGDTAKARAVLAAMKRTTHFAQQAWLLRVVGDTAASYDMFERAIAARDGDALWILTSVPTLYPMWKEPRYQALFARVGLSPESTQ